MEKEKSHYKMLKTTENSLAEAGKKNVQVSLFKKDLGQTELGSKPEEKKDTKYDKPSERKNNSFSNKFGEERKKFERKNFNRLHTEKLGTWRRSRGTKGGRRFTSTCLILAKDEEKKSISFAYAGGKEPIIAFRKSIRKAQKKLINYFPSSPRTIPHDILISYKATTIFLKPAPPGSGIKAGGVLNKLFKFLEIKDISAKIIGSRRNKLNVIRTALMALDKLTGKKYDY